MNLQNIIIYLFIIIFLVYYTFKYYKKNDIIVGIIIILFFAWFIINMNIVKTIDNYYKKYFYTFTLIFIGFPLLISIIINIFLKYNLLYVFTAVFFIQWIIFLNINPCSLDHNNKYKIMNKIPKKFKPGQEYLLSNISIEDINFPIIIKPIICSGMGLDIYVIKNKNEYLDILIKNKINQNEYMMQELLKKHDLEVKILYEKYPWNKEGKIINIYLHKSNNFESDLEEYTNMIFDNKKNMSYLITPELNNILGRIFEKIPNYNVGRFDILLKNLEDLNKLKFKIVEINGTMGMEIKSKSYSTSLNKNFQNDLIVDFQWYLRRLIIGFYNIITLNGYNPINLIIVMFLSFRNMIACSCWENLFSLYS